MQVEVRPRLQFLDALRGIAAIAVVIFHYMEDLNTQGILRGWQHSVADFTHNEFDFGRFGVALFFLISGYIIPNSLGPTRHDVRRFCISRFFRLFPLYWVVLISALVFPWPTLDETFPIPTILINATMLQGFVGKVNIIGATWTLQIELIFYALCVLLASRDQLRRPLVCALVCLFWLAVALALALGRDMLGLKLPVALPVSLCLMFFGTLWRQATLAKLPEAKRLVNFVLPAIVVIVLPVCIFGYHRDFGFHEDWRSYYACYAVAFTMFCVGTTLVKFTFYPAVWLGKISYSIYLIHPLIAGLVYRAGFRAADMSIPPVLYVLVLIAIMIVASWATYELIERPSVRLGRTFMHPTPVLQPTPTS